MSKVKHNLSVYHLSSEENTLLQMPKFNSFSIGHGIHGDTKYSRNKKKKELQRLLKEELG